MNTGEKIRYLREKKGITQDELAKAAGYKDRSSIAKIESGGSDPSQRMLLKIANVLEVSPAELLEETPAHTSKNKDYDQSQGEPVYLKHGEVRIMAKGFDRMPEEKRKKAFDLAKMIFSEYAEYFEEGADDDET